MSSIRPHCFIAFFSWIHYKYSYTWFVKHVYSLLFSPLLSSSLLSSPLHESKSQPCVSVSVFRIPPCLSSSTISFRCLTVLGWRGTSETVAAMFAPLTSLSSNRKPCAWSSPSTSGTCPPPPPPLHWLNDMDLKDPRVHWEHLEYQEFLGHGTGLLLFSLPLPPRLLLPLHILLTKRPSRLPQAQTRPRRPAPATDHPTPAMGVPQCKHPAVLPQTHHLKVKGTDWGPSPAP